MVSWTALFTGWPQCVCVCEIERAASLHRCGPDQWQIERRCWGEKKAMEGRRDGGIRLEQNKGFILCQWWGVSELSGGSGWLCWRLHTAGRCRRTCSTSGPWWSPPGLDGHRLEGRIYRGRGDKRGKGEKDKRRVRVHNNKRRRWRQCDKREREQRGGSQWDQSQISVNVRQGPDN